MKKLYNYIDYLGFLHGLGFILLFGAEPFKTPFMFSISIVVIAINLLLSLKIFICLLRFRSALEGFRKKILTTFFYLLLSVIMIIMWVNK
ncbi:hypothetical protein OA84_01950 [Kaistella solincola]|uniref:Uncharacterized protein n=1 Tax=Kaistella solincola TaxID=510955 RepID=A0ABR4ZSH0_9FLAO|nr:hypothetical protein OA84_01950 [Kaistella solincola]